MSLRSYIFSIVMAGVLISGLPVIPASAQNMDLILKSECLVASDYSTVTSAGGYLFAATVYGFMIFDITDPTNPVELVHQPTDGICINISIYGDYAFICDSAGGFSVWDISDILNPRLTGSLNPPGLIRDICPYNDQYFFAMAEDYGIDIIDYSDPENLALENYIFTGGEPSFAVVQDNWLYISLGVAGLGVYDVTNPLDPEYQLNWNTFGGNANGLTLMDNGEYLAVADFNNGTHVLDLTFPNIPSWVATVSDSTFLAIDASSENDYALCSYYNHGIRTFNSDGDTLDYMETGIFTTGVETTSGYTYVCRGDSGLKVVRSDPPESLLLVNEIFEPGRPVSHAKNGDYIYVASVQDGLQVLDVSDVNNPILIESVPTGEYTNSVIMHPEGGYLYVTDFFDGVNVFSISDPAHPDLISTFATDPDTGSHMLAFHDGYLYVAIFDYGFNIYDANDPVNLTLEFASEEMPLFRTLALSADLQYMFACCSGREGLKIFSLPEPDSAVFEYEITDWFYYPRHMAVKDNYGYLADDEMGLYVLDITNPFYIFKVDSLPVQNLTVGTSFIDDQFLYLSDYAAGFAIVDYSNPLDIEEVGRAETPGYAGACISEVALTGEQYLYITDRYDFRIYQMVESGVAPGQPNISVPGDLALLYPVYPNPFNASANITFELFRQETVTLTIYNVSGGEVAVLLDEELQPGTYNRRFDAESLSSGVYFARLKTAASVQAQKLLLIK